MTTLSVPEIAAALVAYSLSLTRLFNAGRALWAYVPIKFQPVIPAIVMILPQFAVSLGLVKTKVDLLSSVVMAIGAFLAALKGVHVAPPVASSPSLKIVESRDDPPETPKNAS